YIRQCAGQIRATSDKSTRYSCTQEGEAGSHCHLYEMLGECGSCSSVTFSDHYFLEVFSQTWLFVVHPANE
uniref:Uncharacterized protein n=1 Tax=Globisporangium ultimum (strain ATCC 200006 / CBS 805.95 / DAOM BR144) TaxID=431595 RepID=K3WCR5_GLOUD